MDKQKYIECAKIINTHGCHGGVKLESWCNSPEDILSLSRLFIFAGDTLTEYKIKKASVFKQYVIIDFYGIDTMDAAMLLKNKVVFAKRSDFKLKEGEFFIADMIGLKVIDASDGKIYGTITDIVNRGASDIYVVETENGERMIPAVEEFIDRVDIKGGVYVNTIPGLLD